PIAVSMAASSAAVGGRPTPKEPDCAAAAAMLTTQRTTTGAASRLHVPIAHRAVGLHAPALDAVVVIVRVQSADRDERRPGGLRVAGLVGTARDQRRVTAVPAPFEPEPGEGLRQDRRLQLRVLPRLSAVHAHLDTADGAASRPREARDLVR